MGIIRVESGKIAVQQIDAKISSVIDFDDPILVHDTFEVSSLWNGTGTGLDYSVARDAAAAYFNAYGIRLQTKITTPAADDFVKMDRDYAISNKNLLKVSALFRIVNPAAEVKEFVISANHQIGDLLGIARFRYMVSTGIWYYYDAAGSYVEFLANSNLAENHWHRLSLVTNTTAGKYGIMVVDATKKDLSAIPINISYNPGQPDSFNVSLTLIAAGATQCIADIDNIIVKYV